MKSRDELPSLEVIKIKILEKHASRKQNRTEDQGALLTKPFRNTNNKCGNYKDKSKSKVSDYRERQKIQCFKCGRIGHKSTEFEKRDFKPAAKTIQELLYANVDAEKACGVQEKLNDEYWCLDNGCTTHLCKDSSKFVYLKLSETKRLSLANNTFT